VLAFLMPRVQRVIAQLRDFHLRTIWVG
jgi:hypothetical protein